MQFSEIPGHPELKKTLVSSYEKNHLAHAQLFSGREGTAALPLAISFATYLFCENKTSGDSCGSCDSCHKMSKHIHPDMHYFYPIAKSDNEKVQGKQAEIWRSFISEQPYGTLDNLVSAMDTESKQNQISKEDARRIIKTVSMKSFEGGFKILLIWYPELMNASSANAILKVLEEPPENTLYLLVTHNYENLITTIVSRVQLINVPAFSDDEIRQYLIDHNDVESHRAEQISGLAYGSLNQALAELTAEENLEFQVFQNWMRACFSNNFEELSIQSDQFGQSPKSHQRRFIRFAIELVRNALLIHQAESLVKSLAKEREFISNFGRSLSVEILGLVFHELGESLGHLERNANPKITHLALSIRLSQIIRKKR